MQAKVRTIPAAGAPEALVGPTRRGAHRRTAFRAMASPCEVLVDGGSADRARELGEVARAEALRIEAKYSRYRGGNVVARLNAGDGRPVEVDAETAALLDFADACHASSGGRFDVTSGTLRAAWRFDGSDRVPAPEAVAALLDRVGWHRVRRRATPGGAEIALPRGMEIDLGGLGKEYAVDRVAALLAARTARPFLVNFGGDLVASGPPAEGAWRVGVERPDAPPWTLALVRGALATSGDARRYLLKGGARLGHVLDPRTGWPVAGAPRSVTVAAPTCSAAGALATVALLHGAGAEAFLEGQSVRWRTERDGPEGPCATGPLGPGEADGTSDGAWAADGAGGVGGADARRRGRAGPGPASARGRSGAAGPCR